MAPALSLREFAEKTGVKYFLFNWVDLFGVDRAKLVPASAAGTLQVSGAGFAGFATYIGMTAAYPDMFAMPDLSTTVVLPWKPEVGWVACDLVMNGEPLQQAPRVVLKNQIKKAKEMGFQMKTGVECEFHLFVPSATQADDIFDTDVKPAYEQMALMRKYDVIKEICDCMEILGWKPYQNDHEDGHGQFEMNWTYDDCLVTADRHVFFKYMAKSIAEKHGMRATFMPKPHAARAGTGAHCHVSIWSTENHNINLFEDPAGELGLSKLGYHFIGGVLAHATALCAMTNPTVNSYKRIDGSTTSSGSSWAPCSISYTGNNRTHMLRIPEGDRFEFRLADGAVNPYLLQAVLLASGLDGVKRQTDPGERADYNGHLPHPEKKLPSLPANLLDALRELEKSTYLREALGPACLDTYIELKMEQWRAYSQHVSQWELDTTLNC
eukprot:TRINITY_DN2027_c0_g2_i1.p1 TRINITY_DN2027_c0_g2~~TRINITY_DN2027_c0_g2_i1.p1  ORF type:complete len:438 (+),score=73.42 TRINITY_DN2027_c0_g2_i1:264-1577(+)